LETVILNAQERRSKIIEDARDTYNVAIQTATEAKMQTRLEYQMAMLMAEDAELMDFKVVEIDHFGKFATDFCS
jgi:hypothetical protein